MGLFSKTKTSQPAAHTDEPEPSRANNWHRKHNIGDTVRLTDGREMQIGGYDHEWYSGWITGQPGLSWVTNADIRCH